MYTYTPTYNGTQVFGSLARKHDLYLDLDLTSIVSQTRSYTKAFGYKIAGLFPRFPEAVWGMRGTQDLATSAIVLNLLFL